MSIEFDDSSRHNMNMTQLMQLGAFDRRSGDDFMVQDFKNGIRDCSGIPVNNRNLAFKAYDAVKQKCDSSIKVFNIQDITIKGATWQHHNCQSTGKWYSQLYDYQNTFIGKQEYNILFDCYSYLKYNLNG
ncbi:hypothetical protein SPOM_SPAC212.03 [Schizosaccharomyces pombe]|uniref:Uncharacterized protein C212.03 n=1 Tax=Schizosaccharomyces pombe (strain 972 / ATCC 24843) TaxID=284812 RepID=YM03_SCHPO|nr:uncharacterized protein SPAC212.03 [Schizosaccharomyces pombe]Q9HGP9.1 RecName: Full=Uncharacterized protein C212.03 [Schizosaccharomyces pombe 972h-]CAC05737.1 hypothetical protein SPAC212.03 [Schizosaccharomyces pombe]|eukprot:NP_595037.1 uncharacterized protein [Schizosaccharomyces pombe]